MKENTKTCQIRRDEGTKNSHAAYFFIGFSVVFVLLAGLAVVLLLAHLGHMFAVRYGINGDIGALVALLVIPMSYLLGRVVVRLNGGMGENDG